MTNEEIVLAIAKHEATLEALSGRVDKAESIIEEIRELTTTTQLIAQRQNNIDEKLDDLSQTVKALDAQPKENWNKVVSTVITVIISVVVTAVVTALITLL